MFRSLGAFAAGVGVASLHAFYTVESELKATRKAVAAQKSDFAARLAASEANVKTLTTAVSNTSAALAQLQARQASLASAMASPLAAAPAAPAAPAGGHHDDSSADEDDEM